MLMILVWESICEVLTLHKYHTVVIAVVVVVVVVVMHYREVLMVRSTFVWVNSILLILLAVQDWFNSE